MSHSTQVLHGRRSENQEARQSALTRDPAPTFFYGSPGTMSGPTAPLLTAATTTFEQEGSSEDHGQNINQRTPNDDFPARPRLGGRSVSSPNTLPTSRTTLNSITARLSNVFHNTPHYVNTRTRGHEPPSHEWTLFGQMMEDQGPLSLTPQRGSSTTPNEATDLPFGRNGALVNVQSPIEEVRQPVEDATGVSSSRTSSPAWITTLEDDSEEDSESLSGVSSDTRLNGTSVDVDSVGGNEESGRQRWFLFDKLPTLTVLHRNVLKCAIAYFIASLFTFSPVLSDFIGDLTTYGPGSGGKAPSAHMVATIAVYFNPAKTVGAMVEADLFCLFGLLYAAFVCGASMSMFWWLELRPGWEWLGDAVAILWIGISMSLVAWLKLWMASPTFNTACSMMVIIIFVVIVKEGGLHTLAGVSTIVICGSLISNLVCYLIWPQTATQNLQVNMTKTLESFSTLLSMLTKGFLLEGENFIEKTGLEKIQKAVDDHQSSFTSLKKNLAEAKKEWIDGGDDGAGGVLGIHASFSENRRKKAYQDAVDSLNRLAQHLNGLRSGTRLQYDLTKAGMSRRRKGKGNQIEELGMPEDESMMLKAAADMFGALVDEVGSPLKALTKACTFTFNELRQAFIESRTRRQQDRNSSHPPKFDDMVDGIEKALVRFESTSNHALLRAYNRSDVHAPPSPSLGSRTAIGSGLDKKENDLLVSNDQEHVFLVYFFIFTLQEFAKELVGLVDAMERIYTCEQSRLNRRLWLLRVLKKLKPTRWRWNWKNGQKRSLQKRISLYLVPEHRIVHPGFPKIEPHAPNTIQTPSRKKLSFNGRMKQRLWSIGARMKERDIKFALKAGMATAMLAAPAFFDATRPIFIRYWGDWALISFFVVISPTIGATNYLSFQRVLGTLFGAGVAAGIYTLFPHNPIVLPFFGFLFSLPCFYMGVSRPRYLSASRFVLLTYNLTCLYCYNTREDDISVLNIAFHRAVAVTVGVIWAAFVSHFWWPSEARRELSKVLGEFCLNIGWLYTRLVASNSYAPGHAPDGQTNGDQDLALLLRHDQDVKLKNSIHEFMAMELHLQIKLIELQGLLAQTQHEPRLKGPFPVELYRNILTGLQTILDRLHSMRCVTTREEWHTSVSRDFIIPVNKERREMVGNIILSFSTLASAFRLKAPLPPYLPPAEKSRQRLVAALRNLDVVRNREIRGSRQLLFFAYAITMRGVTQELERLGKICQEAFGVIGQTPEEFEALFPTTEEGRNRIDYVA